MGERKPSGENSDRESLKISRRELFRFAIRALIVSAGLSAASPLFIDRNKLGLLDLLKPVRAEELEERESPLWSRALAKERELKEWCAREAERICREYGSASQVCQWVRKLSEHIVVKATEAVKGKKFAMALDLNKCIGCRRCAYACVMENNVGRGLGIEWIKVLSMPREDMEFTKAELYYGPEAPREDRVYVPVACMHCDQPPCVMVCPVKATWKEEDGIVVIDYDRCIGCKYCIAACPYSARYFNLTTPKVPVEQLNPNMHIFGNVPRPVHVVEKCTWCIQRTRSGGTTACVEVCPVGARVFGDLNDPKSPIRHVIEKYGGFVLKPEAGTRPRFFYFFGPARTPPRTSGGESR